MWPGDVAVIRTGSVGSVTMLHDQKLVNFRNVILSHARFGRYVKLINTITVFTYYVKMHRPSD